MPTGSGSKLWSKETLPAIICPNYARRSQCLRTAAGVQLASQDGSSCYWRYSGLSQYGTAVCGLHCVRLHHFTVIPVQCMEEGFSLLQAKVCHLSLANSKRVEEDSVPVLMGYWFAYLPPPPLME